MSRENWWLDYAEGELDPATHAQMRALLRYSQVDQEIVESLTSTKELLKDHRPPASEPADELFFDRLHDKIMAAVEETSIAPAPRMGKKMAKRVALSSGGIGAFTALLLSAYFLSASPEQVAKNSTDQVLQAAVQNPAESLPVLAVQSQNDFFVDVASASFDDLNIKQLEGLIRTKVR
jgi:hypothetical protein